jgi:hypothetical protein
MTAASSVFLAVLRLFPRSVFAECQAAWQLLFVPNPFLMITAVGFEKVDGMLGLA